MAQLWVFRFTSINELLYVLFYLYIYWTVSLKAIAHWICSVKTTWNSKFYGSYHVTYMHTKHVIFLWKICPQTTDRKKMKFKWRDNKLVLMFLNEKRNKLIFWVHPVPTRRRQLENIMVWSQNWSCIRTYFRMSVRQFEVFCIILLLPYPCILSKGARFVLLAHLLPNTVILVRSNHWYPEKLEKSIWFGKNKCHKFVLVVLSSKNTWLGEPEKYSWHIKFLRFHTSAVKGPLVSP